MGPKSHETAEDRSGAAEEVEPVSDTGPEVQDPTDVVLQRLFRAAGPKKAITLNGGEANLLALYVIRLSNDARNLFQQNRHLMEAIQAGRKPRWWRRVLSRQYRR